MSGKPTSLSSHGGVSTLCRKKEDGKEIDGRLWKINSVSGRSGSKWSSREDELLDWSGDL